MIESQQQEHRVRRTVVGSALVIALLAGLGWLVWWSVKGTGERQAPDVVAVSPQNLPQMQRGAVPAPLPEMKDPGATLVSLKLEQATPRQAIEALAQSSGAKIQALPANLLDQIKDKRVTMSLDRRPFWEAMSGVCRQAGVWPAAGNSTQVSADVSGRGRCPSVVSGSFLVTLFQIQHTATVDASQSAALHAIRVEMMLLAEPKLRQGLAGTRGTIEEAVDESGHSLKADVRPAMMVQVLGAPSQARGLGWFQVFLSYPENAGKRIAKLKGYASARMERVQTVEVTVLSKPGEIIRTTDGCGVQFKQISDEGGQTSVDLELTGQPPQQLFQRFANPSAMVKVVDGAGNELFGRGWGSNRNAAVYTLKAFFDSSKGKAAKVILNVPMEMTEVRVPFEFTDLPLP